MGHYIRNNAHKNAGQETPFPSTILNVGLSDGLKASVVMLRLSCPTETVIFNKITRNIVIVLSFKDSPRKPLGRRPCT